MSILITNPSSNSSGAFVYNSSNTSVADISGNYLIPTTNSGTTTITANQLPYGNYGTAFTQTIFQIYPSSTISNFIIPSVQYGSLPFTIPDPSSNSNGAFTYAVVGGVPGVATINGNTLTPGIGGQAIIEVFQAASGTYSASFTTTTFNVTPVTPSLTITSPSTGIIGVPLPLTASSNSSGSITWSVDNSNATVSNNDALFFNQPGSVIVTATQAETNNYTRGTAIQQVQIYFQGVSYGFSIPNASYGTQSFPIPQPKSNNSAPFTYTSNAPLVAEISGNYIVPQNAGISTITATQDACGNYGPTIIQTTFTVQQAVPSLEISCNISQITLQNWGIITAYTNNPNGPLICGPEVSTEALVWPTTQPGSWYVAPAFFSGQVTIACIMSETSNYTGTSATTVVNILL